MKILNHFNKDWLKLILGGVNILNIHLTTREIEIIKILFRFRGATAVQIATCLYYTFEPSKSEKSSTHNHLARLKTKKVIKSKKIESHIAEGSLYYLSPSGYELAKDYLDIDVDQVGDGFSNELNKIKYSDLSYDTYKPPFEQIGHHLLCTNSLLQLEFYFKPPKITSRTSAYAARIYYQNNVKSILRPDAEFKTGENSHYFLEIDMATENSSQLLLKFKNYKEYFNTLKVDQLPQAIFFIMKGNGKSTGFKRRCKTVISTYLNVMEKKYSHLVNLIIVSLNDFANGVKFEIHKNKLTLSMLKEFMNTRIDSDYEFTLNFHNPREGGVPFAFVYNNKHLYKYYYLHFAHQHESFVYGNFLNFLWIKNKPSPKTIQYLRGLNSDGMKQIIIINDLDPQLQINFPKGLLSNNLLAEIQLLKDYTEIIEITI